MHRDLRLAGQLPPLDAPHHMRGDEWRAFREGVVMAAAPGAGALLDVGLDLVSPGLICACASLSPYLEPLHTMAAFARRPSCKSVVATAAPGTGSLLHANLFLCLRRAAPRARQVLATCSQGPIRGLLRAATACPLSGEAWISLPPFWHVTICLHAGTVIHPHARAAIGGAGCELPAALRHAGGPAFLHKSLWPEERALCKEPGMGYRRGLAPDAVWQYALREGDSHTAIRALGGGKVSGRTS